ncbi:MAG: hypothetical protein HCA25_05600 [Dolichospermum sp. DET50]|jgi:hypothetical protein|nr:hypothetical protein [Dolichospermum sp. DET66]MBS3031768.1 hypothetical protein [Dolichospermum sp. DET67]MBS3036979.1 hypothetical protein [Dolichospermum sp. DET50]QSX68991.1 MAG: hypothetical protein EZY12_04765 [Dolichospermum sp. DET69]
MFSIVDDIVNLNKAKDIGNKAEQRYKHYCKELKRDWEKTEKVAESYAQIQTVIQNHTISKFIKLTNNLIKLSSQENMDFLEPVNISAGTLKNYKSQDIKSEKLVTSSLTIVIAGVTTSQILTGLISSVGVASTGTAISELSGAAGWSATLAWLGGGSLASGGGGMALGTLLLGGISITAALTVGSLMLVGEGKKALKQAKKYKEQVSKAVHEIKQVMDFLKQLRQIIRDLTYLINELNNCATTTLNQLESQPLDSNIWEQGNLLIKVLREIIETPVLSSEGKIDPSTAIILEKYSGNKFS